MHYNYSFLLITLLKGLRILKKFIEYYAVVFHF